MSLMTLSLILGTFEKTFIAQHVHFFCCLHPPIFYHTSPPLVMSMNIFSPEGTVQTWTHSRGPQHLPFHTSTFKLTEAKNEG